MFTLTIENDRTDKLTLTQNESRYQVVEIQGLNPPPATINLSKPAGFDGSKFVSSALETRNVVITVKLNGEIEKNRLYLYRYFRTKQWCKIYYKNGSRDVYIEGYVETIENDLFTLGQTVQISVICPDPYFKGMAEVVSDISKTLGMFTFPFAFGTKGITDATITDDAIEFGIYDSDRIVNVHNEGESDTGVTITMTARGTVLNPTLYNVDTREEFGLNFTMQNDDVITINTRDGEKSVTLYRGGEETNLINKVKRVPSWLKLSIGDNQLTYNAESGLENLTVVFTHRPIYEGV